MTKQVHWLQRPKHLPADVDGKFVELHIYQKTPRFTADGVRRMRVEYHPATSGLFCIWVAYFEYGELAMDDIDEHHMKRHPDQAKADYICEAQYP
jgi:hypothetical protein